MTALCFVDTNVFVYARDASEPEKQPVAREWIAGLWALKRGRVSYQVLNEYYSVVTDKLKPGLPRAVARADVTSLISWNPVGMSRRLVEGAWVIQDRLGLSWWDCLVLAAAQTAGCDVLLSEDLTHDLEVGGVRILDPFVALPEEVLFG